MEISKMEISKWKFPVEISRNFHFGNCVLEISIRRGKRGLRSHPYKTHGPPYKMYGEIHGPRISHTFCMGISLIHFVWGMGMEILVEISIWKFPEKNGNFQLV